MTKEEVLQKANDYCNEKGYTEETLTGDFKEKFSEFFSKKYPETSVDDETAIADLQFNLNTAFSATSKGITAKQKSFDTKENEYKSQIEELRKKVGKPQPKEGEDNEPVIPKELQEKLDELEKFKDAQRKQEKYKSIISLAKTNIREDLHKSFENYALDYAVDLNESDEEQAKKLRNRFQEIFKDSIGDIKPLKPLQKQKDEEEMFKSVKKVKITG